MFIVLENTDSTLLVTRVTLMSYLQSRMLAGVDIEKDLDIFPIDLASRIEVSAGVTLDYGWEVNEGTNI